MCPLHACMLRLVVAEVDRARLYLTSYSIHAVVYFCGVHVVCSVQVCSFFLVFF